MSVQTRGTLPNTSLASASLGAVALPSMTSGQAHSARIVYAAGTLETYLDGAETPKLSAPFDLAQLDLGPTACVATKS